jgi:hypothetical protein
MQGQIGCCVGCTGEEVVRQIVYLMTGVKCNPGTPNELSWRFVYALAKCLDGQPGEGTNPSLVAGIIKNYGVPLATICPNNVTLDHETFVYNRVMANIPAAAFADAAKRKAGPYLSEPVTEAGVKKALAYAQANKGGVMILRQVGATYWQGPDGANTWDKAKLLGTHGMLVPSVVQSGHEEFLTGYDYEQGTGRMRVYWLNHWSPQWCSTGGTSQDGGRAWEYFDIWQTHTVELLVVVQSAPATPGFKYAFSKTLQRGDQGADVVALQHVLMLEGCFTAGQTFTGYYGDVTFAGVVQLQQKYASAILAPAGLTHGTGAVGPRTLSWLVTNYGN